MPESSTLTPNALESLLRDVDRDAFVAFVAELWSAAGWETERAGPVLTVSSGDETRRILVWADDRTRIERLLGAEPDDPDPDGIDTVVTRRRDEASARTVATARQARVIDTGGLYDRLLYAVDRERARDLCRVHLGDDVEPRPPRDPEQEGREIEDLLRPGTVLVAVALLTLVVAVAVGLSGQSGGNGGLDPGTPGPGMNGTPMITPVGVGEVTPGSGTQLDGEGTPRPGATEAPRLPGDLRPTAERFERLQANASTFYNRSTSCLGPPRTVVVTAVGALRFNEPGVDEGIRTVYNLTDTDRTTFETFEVGITSEIYRPLFTFDEVAFESASESTPSSGSSVSLSVVVSRNRSLARYDFRLRPLEEDCWIIDQIFRTVIDLPGFEFQRVEPGTDTPVESTRTATPINATDNESAGTATGTPTPQGTGDAADVDPPGFPHRAGAGVPGDGR